MGFQTTNWENTIKYTGTGSLKWRYTLPGTPAGNYPTIEMVVPSGKNDWSLGTTIGMWIYMDLTGPKTFWTIQPNLQHPYPTNHDLGNWNTGAGGIPNNTWLWHEWNITGYGDISNVSHLQVYYHGGDGWDSLAIGGNVDIYLDEITLMESTANTYSFNSSLIPLTTQSGFADDFSIISQPGGQFVGYISPTYNYGRWTDVRGWDQTANLLAGGGGFYDHGLVWWSNSTWSDGTIVSHTKDTTSGNVIQWHGDWYNNALKFNSKINSQQIAVNSTGLIVVKTDTQVSFSQATNVVNALWVEFGWEMNSFVTTAIVRRDGYNSTNITSVTPQVMSGTQGIHYFNGDILNSSNGDYICGYGGTTFNVAAALVPISWDNSSSSYCRAWNTNGIVDQTDTIELHYYNPATFGTPKSVINDETHRIVYFLVISPNSRTGYDWVPSTAELDTLFISQTNLGDWYLY